MHDQAPSLTSPAYRRRVEVSLIALFLVVIAAPGLGLLFGVTRAQVSEAEMRTLAEFPAWSWQREALAKWPERFQTYFNDRFAFRNELIHLQAAVLWHGFHTSASDTVIAGKGDWLFYADDGGLQDYVQAEPFTEDQLRQWQQTLERTRDWLGSRGTRFLFVLAPDKQMIYPELMPASLRRLHDQYRADQLLAHMRAHSTVEILDLRPALLAAKPRELLYHHYDTHWNDRGALIAYQQIASRLRRWFPTIEPMQREDFDTSATASSGDRTTMLGLVDAGKESMPGLVPRHGWTAITISPQHPDPYGEDGTVITEVRGRSGPRAVMFRDSFASRLIPFMSEHFSRILYQWQNDFDPELVRRERPDVVIQEMVGRHLHIFVPTPSLVPDPEVAGVGAETGLHGQTVKRGQTETTSPQSSGGR
jgi:alginate O-acetyltransferase complex protein AlgJ